MPGPLNSFSARSSFHFRKPAPGGSSKMGAAIRVVPGGSVMVSLRFLSACFAASSICFFALPVAGDTYQLILRGKVAMPDGSPPPKSVGIERVCSDTQGSAPGPVTDKKGEYLWRMEVDPMRTRTCRLRATLAGYASTEIDISALNSYSNTDLPPLMLSARGADPNTIQVLDSEIPSKAQPAWKAAMK